MADAISIEETNRLRVAIGLKPLPVPGAGPAFKDDASSDSEEELGSTLESREAEGFENWKRVQDEREAKRKRIERNEAIKKAREAAQRLTKLEGKGFGEQDGAEEVDTRTWLIQQKKRQKKLEKERERARKIEEELREREEREYTSKDLAGVKVGHAMKDFEDEGGEQILTLKDATIEENEEEGDELVNIQLTEKEKLNERLDLKKKKPAYNPNDVSEDGPSVLLQQYDEVIDGKKRKRFTLDDEGSMAQAANGHTTTGETGKRSQPVSLDILKDLPATDYQEPPEVKIKKPKKKKDKSTRRKAIDDDPIFPEAQANGNATNGDSMDVDAPDSALPPKTRGTTSFVDDEDLQSALAKQRRQALKQRKKFKPEDIIQQIREEGPATPAGDNEEPSGDTGLVIDETSEFVANLQRPEPAARRRPSTQEVNGTSSVKPKPESDEEEDEDVDMDHSYNDIKDESDAAGIKQAVSESHAPETGLEEEAPLSRGIGAAFNLLTKRGILQPANGDELSQRHRDRQRFLREKRQREEAAEVRARAQRERDRASGKLDRMSAREREEYARWENKQRDQAESRYMSDVFSREYRPDVQLSYVDEFGRQMGPKEAFKQLSHQFHGKGSGKQKTEKHLKKIEEERKKDAQSNLDSGQGSNMSSAAGATAKKNKQAGVRLA